MSDTSQGPGWWLASDGKWYPPESAPGAELGSHQSSSPSANPQPQLGQHAWGSAAPNGSPPQNKSNTPRNLLIGVLVVVVLLGGGCAALLFAGSAAVDEAAKSINEDLKSGNTQSDQPVGAAKEGNKPSAKPAGPAAPDASPYVLGFGDLSKISLPAGEAGKASIVWSGDTIDRRGSVMMIIRNNTSQNIGRIDVTGTARDAAGTLVGSGSSQGFNPVVVAPGEIAFGYVYFDYDQAGKSFKFAFEVDASPVGGFMSALPVVVTEINNTGGQLIGSAKNELDKEVGGPIEAAVLCFDANGVVTDNQSGFLEQDDLAPGGTGSFSIDLLDGHCSNGLISASGHDF